MDSSSGQDPFNPLDSASQQNESTYQSPFESSISGPGNQPEVGDDTPLPQGTTTVREDATAQSPPKAKQHQPQYYIAFSVTGIERSNPKNPIIRFDAKVANLYIKC